MWIRAKFLKPANPTWFTLTDNLKGFDYIYATNEESLPFHGSNYTEFLFKRGSISGSSGVKWLRAPKSSVIPATPSATASVPVSSSYL